jgi:hypothetical protein
MKRSQNRKASRTPFSLLQRRKESCALIPGMGLKAQNDYLCHWYKKTIETSVIEGDYVNDAPLSKTSL